MKRLHCKCTKMLALIALTIKQITIWFMFWFVSVTFVPCTCTGPQRGCFPPHSQCQRHCLKNNWVYRPKRLDCNTPNLVYSYMLCNCNHTADYVGSTKGMKARWSKLKQDIRNNNWTACGPTSHFGQHHQGDLEEAIAGLHVVLVDCCEEERELKITEDKWMCNLRTLFVGLNSHNEVISNRRRNFGMT